MISAMTTPEQWQHLGRLLAAQRVRGNMSKRAAAARAGISEGWWRRLEEGGSPARAETVVRAARAVGLDVDEALAVVGVEMPPEVVAEPADPVTLLVGGIVAELQALSAEVRRLGDAVDSLATRPPAPPSPAPRPVRPASRASAGAPR